MKKKMKIALIGYGKRGKTLEKAVRDSSAFELEVLCDIEGKKFSSNSVKFTTDYEDVVRYEIDAVIICVPPALHFEVASFFLGKKIHTLVEKPLCITPSDAIELKSFAEKHRVYLISGYHLRFDPLFQKAKSLLDAGELGEVIAVRGRQAHDWGGGKPGSWSADKTQSGGGTIIDNASHYLDLFEFFFGKIARVSAMANNRGFSTGVEDCAFVTVQFSNDVVGSIEVSWQDKRGRNNALIIWGTRGVLEIKDDNEISALSIKNYSGNSSDSWNVLQKKTYYLPKGIESRQRRGVNTPVNSIASAPSLLLNAFGELIQGKIDNGDVSSGVRATVLADACYQSVRTGGAVAT